MIMKNRFAPVQGHMPQKLIEVFPTKVKHQPHIYGSMRRRNESTTESAILNYWYQRPGVDCSYYHSDVHQMSHNRIGIWRFRSTYESTDLQIRLQRSAKKSSTKDSWKAQKQLEDFVLPAGRQKHNDHHNILQVFAFWQSNKQFHMYLEYHKRNKSPRNWGDQGWFEKAHPRWNMQGCSTFSFSHQCT